MSVKHFEQHVEEIIQSGAPDRDTAIRWILQAEAHPVYGVEYLEYSWDLPHGYISRTALN